jgi:protein-serine/threonine kinase
MGTDGPLHREEYIAEQRGFVHQHDHTANQSTAFPTPPSSNRSVTESEGDDSRNDIFREFFVVPDARAGKVSYRPIRLLGQGTFSKVVLATSESFPSKRALRETPEAALDAKKLVAIKIVEHGPAGGANAERMQLSLKREIELMQEISHPSLIHLESFDTSGDEALLVLNYCAGGDLFDLACQHRDVLSQQMVQRIFAELVGAVLYLHNKWIVHRDIKLESTAHAPILASLTAADVLVNIPVQSLSQIADPQTHPYPLVTLTDLGLSRELPRPPAPPTLTTRCGSEDYAAPEIMLSQPYDGRLTDAWALGVLLYSLVEGRLPFDPPPYKPGSKVSRRGRTKAAFRIARCDWIWARFGDVNGEWDEGLGRGWEGARDVVEGLLRKVNRGRWDLGRVWADRWVEGGIRVPGGIRRRNE